MSRSSRLTAQIRILTAAISLAALATILSCAESTTGPADSSTSLRADGLVEVIFHYPDSIKIAPQEYVDNSVSSNVSSSVSTNGLSADLVAMPVAALSGSTTLPAYTVTPVAFAPEAAPTTGKGPNCDDCLLSSVPLGFTFRFFGTDYTSVNIGSNGIVGFGVNNMRDGCCWGAFIARNDVNNNIIAMNWADWMPNAVANGVRYETRGTAPNRRFVLQFNNVPESGGGGRLTAQLVLYEHSNDVVLYTMTASTTVKRNTLTQGIENLPANEAYGLPGRDSTHYVLTNDAVKFALTAVNTAPVVTAPANLVVDMGAGVCAANVSLVAPTVVDDAPGYTVAGVRSDALALDAPYPKGVTTITYTATDVEGLTSSATQTVTVSDKQNPSVVAPAAIAVRTDKGVSLATVEPGVAVASDNCPNVSVLGSRSDNAPLNARYPLGVTTINWKATDASNNTASASQTITVSPNTPPVITVPSGINVDTDHGVCAASVSLTTPSATDDLPGVVVNGVRNDNLALNAAYPKGVTIVTWTATDVDGATASGTQSVTVSDRENPSIGAPENVSVANDHGLASAVVVTGPAGAADNCPGVKVSASRSDNLSLSAPFPVGSTTITWTATDASNNKASANQLVVVRDEEAPVLNVPSDFSVNATMPSGAVVTYAIHASDNVGVSSASCDRASGSVFPVGYVEVHCSASDAAGNVTSREFGVRVVDAHEQLLSLTDFVISLNLRNGSENPLVNQLRAASRAESDLDACTKLDDFIHMVSVKNASYSVDNARFMIQEASRIQSALGCRPPAPVTSGAVRGIPAPAAFRGIRR